MVYYTPVSSYEGYIKLKKALGEKIQQVGRCREASSPFGNISVVIKWIGDKEDTDYFKNLSGRNHSNSHRHREDSEEEIDLEQFHSDIEIKEYFQSLY